MLLNNALLMYDRETKTIWSHYTGEALAGPDTGKTLEILSSSPAVAWKDWVAAHPDTKILDVGGQVTARSGYEDYFADPDRQGVIPNRVEDDRLPGKDLVLGLKEGDRGYAFSSGSLERERSPSGSGW